MQYTYEDLEIFVITRNRPEFIKRAIESVLEQTVKGCPIVVLDNSTDDKTQQMLVQNYPNIKYIHTTQIPLANLKMLQKISSKTFFLLLHDDDLISNNYVSNLLSIINNNDNIDFIAPSQTHFDDIKKINLKDKTTNKYIYFKNKYLFAGYCHNMFPSWSGSLTRTANFKQIDLDENDKLYGKIGDEPLMVKSVRTGTAAIIPNPSGLYYYHHSGQDSTDDNTKITPKQFEDYLRFYKSYVQGEYVKECYASYLLGFSRHVNHYKRFVKNTVSYDDFIKDMFLKGVIDRKILLYSKRYYGAIYKLLTLPLKAFYGTSFNRIGNTKKI